MTISRIYNSVHNKSGKSSSTNYSRKKKTSAFVEKKRTSRIPSLRDIDGR